MASIGPVQLTISVNVPVAGDALVYVSYEITHTLDDIQAGQDLPGACATVQ